MHKIAAIVLIFTQNLYAKLFRIAQFLTHMLKLSVKLFCSFKTKIIWHFLMFNVLQKTHESII